MGELGKCESSVRIAEFQLIFVRYRMVCTFLDSHKNENGLVSVSSFMQFVKC